MTDRQLLERFLQHNHAGAFEELVRVHGPMVLKACQRILLNHHDAEEAFQATFLVLARKARSLLGRPSVAGWLHEVAHRTALNARRARAQRQVREQQVEPMPEVIAETVEGWADVVPLFDQELSRLPEKYRLPVVLCDLEGKGLQEVAQQLGCPLGTLSSRLTRAREMLRQRLVRRGVAVSSGMLAMALSQQAASASVPAALVSSTVQVVNVFTISSAVTTGVLSPHVAALTEGVLKTMFYTQLKQMTLAAVVIVFAGLGTGGLIYQMQAAEPAAKKQTANQGDDNQEVLKRLEGKWNVVKIEYQGQEQPEAEVQAFELVLTFSDKKLTQTMLANNEMYTVEGSFRINAAKTPHELDWDDRVEANQKPFGQKCIMAIFELEGDRLTIHGVAHEDGKNGLGNSVVRPIDFKSTSPDAFDVLWTLQREKP